MQKKILDYLGIAQKAGMIVSGDEGVLKALQNNKAKMVFVASDASIKTRERFQYKCHFYNVSLVNTFTATELSQAIGRLRKILAITDQGIAIALEKIMR